MNHNNDDNFNNNDNNNKIITIILIIIRRRKREREIHQRSRWQVKRSSRLDFQLAGSQNCGRIKQSWGSGSSRRSWASQADQGWSQKTEHEATSQQRIGDWVLLVGFLRNSHRKLFQGHGHAGPHSSRARHNHQSETSAVNLVDPLFIFDWSCRLELLVAFIGR